MKQRPPSLEEKAAIRRHLNTAKWAEGRWWYGRTAASIRRGQRKRR